AFEFVTNRGLGMANTVLFSEPSATTLLLLPTSGIEKGEFMVELGGLREFELKELDRAYLAAARRFGNYTVSIGLSQLGQRDFYAERTGKISLAYHYFDYAFAVSISGIDYSFGGNYGSHRAGTVGAGISYHYRRLHVGAAVDNINSPKIAESSPAINPQYSLYAEFMGKGSFSLTARSTFEKDQAVQLALGQKIDVSERGAVFWGFNTKPFRLGGGFDVWYNAQGAITYAGSYHPTLGFSHNLSVVYHFGKLKKPDDIFK
ncbi:MAG: hypothetical protein ACREBV_02545, partial [Candidatus Zixiibacteriota bacterium]